MGPSDRRRVAPTRSLRGQGRDKLGRSGCSGWVGCIPAFSRARMFLRVEPPSAWGRNMEPGGNIPGPGLFQADIPGAARNSPWNRPKSVPSALNIGPAAATVDQLTRGLAVRSRQRQRRPPSALNTSPAALIELNSRGGLAHRQTRRRAASQGSSRGGAYFPPRRAVFPQVRGRVKGSFAFPQVRGRVKGSEGFSDESHAYTPWKNRETLHYPSLPQVRASERDLGRIRARFGAAGIGKGTLPRQREAPPSISGSSGSSSSDSSIRPR